ncbi:Vacuolar protein sorting-associated protein 41 [Nowakowskiella sp. JEL0407]|nr:Vacuolar protein sorting-associated protein 41 [Nowakowskiella sp. JEL0407]
MAEQELDMESLGATSPLDHSHSPASDAPVALSLDHNQEEDEEEEEEEEDDDEEPKLKYRRLAGSLVEALKKDAVSTLTVSDRFLALGTHWGLVYILDLEGNEVNRWQSHSATVNELSIDTNGEYVASASDDGKVIINNLYNPAEIQSFNLKRPVRGIALEPDYSKRTATRQYVTGGLSETLTLSGKGWFGIKDVIIHSGEGPIYTVKWRNNFIAWASDPGVKIYDTTTQLKFAFIDRPLDSPRADLFRANLCWKDDETLFIGWADSVKIGVVKERSKMDIASGLPAKYVEIVCQFRTDFVVSGIAPFADQIMILAYITDVNEHKNVDVVEDAPTSKRKKAQQPEIHITDIEGNEIANDVLAPIGYEAYQANDYRLAECLSPSPSEASYYIMSPKDIILAKPRDLDDHIEFLVERKKYSEALKAAENAPKDYSGRVQVRHIVDVGQKYIGTLLDEGKYDDAAVLCPKILREDAEIWEKWIFKFAEAKKIHSIRGFIPLKDIGLSPSVYEMVLVYLLSEDQKAFAQCIKDWPTTLYTPNRIIEAVEEVLNHDPKNLILMEALCDLYHTANNFPLALLLGLKLRRPKILDLFHTAKGTVNLISHIAKHVVLVLEYDDYMIKTDGYEDTEFIEESEAVKSVGGISWIDADNVPNRVKLIRRAELAPGVQLFVQNTDQIPVSQCVKQLLDYPKYLHIYLSSLYISTLSSSTLLSSPASEFESLQVELYAEYDYPRLLPFLRTSTHYSIADAFETCSGRDLVPEMVYLLGKLGNNRQALYMIIERLRDVKRAIEFAKEQNDDELWDDLLKYSMDKPTFIIGLLENLGSHIDPIRLIRQIPMDMEIPGLRGALIKIMTDFGIQMSLTEGCEKILINDTVELLENLHKSLKRGISFSHTIKCGICDQDIASEEFAETNTSSSDSTRIFFCQHTFHKSCLLQSNDAKIRSGTPTNQNYSVNRRRLSFYDYAINRIYDQGRGLASDTFGQIDTIGTLNQSFMTPRPDSTLFDRMERDHDDYEESVPCPICKGTQLHK